VLLLWRKSEINEEGGGGATTSVSAWRSWRSAAKNKRRHGISIESIGWRNGSAAAYFVAWRSMAWQRNRK